MADSLTVNLLGHRYPIAHATDGTPQVRLMQFSRPLSGRGILRVLSLPRMVVAGYLLKKRSRGRVTVSEHIPEEYQRLWDAEKKGILLSRWKDHGYLTQRYGGMAGVRYFSAYRGGHFGALAVTVRRGPVVYVAELLVEGREVSLGQLLIHAVSEHYLREGARTIRFVGHDQGLFRRLFAGFEPSLSEVTLPLGGPAEPDLAAVFLDANHWSLTTGDTELF